MNTSVLRAVFARNFVAYFANPTGYVFICVFVLLSSLAAFWPYEFFNSNLANLDQLNFWFPFIMLVFIPAITMSVWAEERRQGTDELLLTIPAADLDIVLGKYLAAVSIYTVSLLFSLVCNFGMLAWLSKGQFDMGLFLGTYLGYWLLGLAMLAIGMVASFLTDNLTVGFVLGAALNAPLVFAVMAEAIFPPAVARVVKQWSVGEQFADFGRGMVTLSAFTYFVVVVVVMLYLSMVLIGRRHWVRGRDWYVMGVHYLVRAVALAIVAVGAIVFFDRFDLRYDATNEKLSSLSGDTKDLLANLDLERPVQIEAFISPVVPELYAQARLDLMNMLLELRARGGEKVVVQIHDTETSSEEAARAEERFGITPRGVFSRSRGAYSQEFIFMGVAFSCGLEKVVLPFIDRGIPVEYELVRSICTVAKQKRRKIGVLRTDARLYGGFSMQGPSSNWPIIDELEKMYEVVQVDPSSPITDKYDALLAVQPSSLGEEEMQNFIAAVRAGQATAIFEDPAPMFAADVPGTSVPRRPPGGMSPFMMRQPMPPKGNIEELWTLLGVNFAGDRITWQDYNPYPQLKDLESEFVFVDVASGAEEPFNQSDEISSRLQLLCLPFPGSVSRLRASQLKFEPLARTSENAGRINYHDMFEFSPFGSQRLNPKRRRDPANMSFVLAAHITGKIPESQLMLDEGDAAKGTSEEEGTENHPHPNQNHADDAGAPDSAHQEPAHETPAEEAAAGEATAGEAAAEEAAAEEAAGEEPAEEESAEEEPQEEKPQETEIDVVLVADIDMMHRRFFQFREQGDNPEAGLDFNFDNVTFVLNVLDVLAGDKSFLEIRKRRSKRFTLRRIDDRREQARVEVTQKREQFEEDLQKARDEEQKALDKEKEKLEERMKKQDLDLAEIARRVNLVYKRGQQRMNAEVDRLERKYEREIKQIEREQDLAIRRVQDRYKMVAVLLPPIPPLIVGVMVFFTRRRREREGVVRSRLR